MPCKKCKDGNYKYGNTGECKYATKEECEKANPKKYNKMKKYPSPIGKKTYEEYAKELKEFNLSKVKKIELGIADDLEKFVKALQKASEQIKSNKTKLSKAIKDIQAQRDEVEKQYNTALKNKKAVDLAVKNSEILAKEIAKTAKELGINPSEVPNVKKLVNLMEQVEGDQEIIDLFINTAKGIINVKGLKII
ncbi:MAG: hypothetical protein GOVbin2390_33 [Prokaryotic dsDNA virus sp.]|nr:MAG: hypothetical protein GOVbin2390_33 [Prokaryotic dsDNA virus sp.]|tara:strand:+ start:31 stop:609 length:579 start_codon:yes stop_codon:yes gene_type:complete